MKPFILLFLCSMLMAGSGVFGANTPGHTWTNRETVTAAKLNDMQEDLLVDPTQIKSLTGVGEATMNGYSLVLGAIPFENVAQMLAFNFSSVPEGTMVQCTGYYTAKAGDFGPPVYWDPSSTATADGLTVFDPAPTGAGRLVRDFTGPVNVLWGGARYGASLTDNTYAAVTGDAFAAMTAYFTAQGGGTYYVPPGTGVLVTDTAIAMPDNTTFVNDGYLAPQRDSGFRLIKPTKVSNLVITGSGTYDGNAHLTGDRVAGSSPIWFQYCENVWVVNTTIRNATTFACGNENSRNIHYLGNLIYNRTGSVDGAEPDTVSGDNQDGIHLTQCSDVYIQNNTIYSVDDSIAFTFDDLTGDAADSGSEWYRFGSYGGIRYTNLVITGNILYPSKADAVAAGTVGVDPGTESKLLGRGIRLSDDSPSDGTFRIKGVTVSHNHITGGLGGILLGSSSSTVYTAIEDAKVEHNFIMQTASVYASEPDADDIISRLNRSTCAGIFISQAVNCKVRGNKISDPGLVGIYMRSGSDVVIEDNLVESLIINEAVGTPSAFQYSALVLANNISPIDGVTVRRNLLKTIDGAGMWVQDNVGSPGVSNVWLIENEIDTPNVLTDVAGAIKYINVDLEEIHESGNQIKNFTPSGDYIDFSQNSVFTNVLLPLRVLAWNTGVYNAANSGRAFDLQDNSGTLTASVETTAIGATDILKLVGKPKDGAVSVDLPSGIEGRVCDLLVDYKLNSPAKLVIYTENSGADPVYLDSAGGDWYTAKLSMGFSTDTPQHLYFEIFHDSATPVASIGSATNSSSNAYDSVTGITDGVAVVKSTAPSAGDIWYGYTVTSGISGDIVLVEFDYEHVDGQGGPHVALCSSGIDSAIASVNTAVFKPNQTGHKQVILVATGTYDSIRISSRDLSSQHSYNLTNLEVGTITTDGTVRIGKVELIARNNQ